MSLDSNIQQLLAIDGATGAAVIDSESGMALAASTSPLPPPSQGDRRHRRGLGESRIQLNQRS